MEARWSACRSHRIRVNFSCPKVGVSAPVTAVVNFSKPARSGDPARAILTLYDPAKQNSALIAGEKRPLAADFTAPFGYYPKPGEAGILGMLLPGEYLEKEGFFLVQPYDPKKIPIVFVHGLVSVPQTWLPVMAALESDPALRGKFQFWVFAYPTGDPISLFRTPTPPRARIRLQGLSQDQGHGDHQP